MRKTELEISSFLDYMYTSSKHTGALKTWDFKIKYQVPGSAEFKLRSDPWNDHDVWSPCQPFHCNCFGLGLRIQVDIQVKPE